ncbi:FCS-Like Zinc finger 8-like [Primulina tabacum]|uniref:FCS-Like Zinc finger 8-like n=1 Tax=Primulina tabacum TaxID=48773 RepID=UPI003F5AD21B
MLRNNRSRTVTTKQAIMADQNPIHASVKDPTKPVSSFLNSPRFFNGFLSRTFSDPETALVSPTSILDTRILPNFVTPFGYDNILSKSPTPCPEVTDKSPFTKQIPEAIGLALVHSINEERTDEKFSRTVFYGAKLNIQIPTIISQPESPNSPADFGIKTRDSQLLSPFSGTPVKDYFTRQLSLKEMELSEDYTCVITHGPNPKTTHIFDDCIVENCCEDDPNLGEDFEKVETGFETNVSNSPPLNFLSSCHTCKQSLEQRKDIYIYRGERAFCSHECRCQEMLFEGMKNEEMDDAF